MTTVAIVDQDRILSAAIAEALAASGCEAVIFEDGASALESFENSLPDLVVAELKCLRIGGMELLRRLRRFSTVPVVFTSHRRDEIDELFGLKVGADDFLVKPFSAEILVLRVRNILRRCGPAIRPSDGTDAPADGISRYGGLALDQRAGRCTLNGCDVPLTPFETAILAALIARPGAVLSRDRLIDAIYAGQGYVDSRTIDSHIKRLRTKMKPSSPGFDPIETLYRGGYRLRAPAVSGSIPVGKG